MFKKIIIWSAAVIVVGAVLFFAIDGSAKKESDYKTVAVERGSIIDKALAVGRIDPRKEVAVKSKISGIVKKTYVEIGDKVEVGDPLFDIAPDPTPLELTEAKKLVEIGQVSFANAKRESDRLKSLVEKRLISTQEYDQQKATCDESELRLKLAVEKLSLIESGKTNISDQSIDNIIRSPIAGTVLSRSVEEGDPIVPLTSFQAGTELMTLAFMEDLIFIGNVDEIDVGKLHEGMTAEIEIGALSSNGKIEGRLVRISPKAHKEEGATLFEVEIAIIGESEAFLRAGYSANADVIITRKEDILLIPERLIITKDSAQFVEVQDTLGTITEVAIETGLSDGINIEVLEGVIEGDLLIERPPREIGISD